MEGGGKKVSEGVTSWGSCAWFSLIQASMSAGSHMKSVRQSSSDRVPRMPSTAHHSARGQGLGLGMQAFTQHNPSLIVEGHVIAWEHTAMLCRKHGHTTAAEACPVTRTERAPHMSA